MKRAGLIVIAVLVTVFLAGADMATAIEPLPQESGFSGFIRPGVGYLNYKSNMVASFLGYDLSDRSIDSLNDSPDSQSNGIVLVPFSLEYTFASTRTQVFLGTDLTDLVRFDFAQQFGVKQGIGNLGIVQGGLLFSGVPAEVWKDPYVVNQRRNKTNRDSTGARLIWDRILGSNLQLQYTYRNIDISSEKSGESLLASGDLTSQDLKLLKRDGDRHAGEILYRFDIAKKHRLTPAFIYTYDNRDGDAMKNDAYDFQLTYGYRGDPFTFTGNVFIGQADYDKRNPIYNKKQDDDRYGIQGALYYRNPWDWRLFGSNPMNFFVSGAYARTNANIDFYDQEATMATVGVFFKW
jgi:hypothetical protein